MDNEVPPAMLGHHIEYLFSLRGSLAQPLVVGPCPGDIRLNFPLTGGTVWGPALAGELLPGGCDFATIRTDGVVLVDVRCLVKCEDGALIDVNYSGVLDLGPDGHGKFLQGVMPERLLMRISARMSTASPRLAWLNRLQCFGIGEASLAEQAVTYDFYALR